MVKFAVGVYCRIRPTRPRSTLACRVIEDTSVEPPVAKQVEFAVRRKSEGEYVNNTVEHFTFPFSEVFDHRATQAEVYDGVARDVVAGALDGYNGTIFAYGQTGSGKTFTITGGERYADRGMIPRVFSQVFEEFDKRPGTTYKCFVSYLEIYNENIYDLLDRENQDKPIEEWNKVQLRDDMDGDLHLKNLRVYEVLTEQDALNILFLGNMNRMTSETPMNQASSRSHCIFTLTLESRSTDSDVVRTSKLHLVDLAGSERVYKTSTGELTRREGRYINLSLHYLEQVILSLHDRGRGTRVHVPYRNSLMTSVLRDSLGGNSRTVFVATVNAEKEFTEESLSTCRFAQRCGMLEQEVLLNEEVDLKVLVARLKKQNAELRSALSRAGIPLPRAGAGAGAGSGGSGSGSAASGPGAFATGGAKGATAGPGGKARSGGDESPAAGLVAPDLGDRELTDTEKAECESNVVTYLRTDDGESGDSPAVLSLKDLSEAKFCSGLLKAAVQRAVRTVSECMAAKEEAERRAMYAEQALEEQTEALTRINGALKDMSTERDRWKDLALVKQDLARSTAIGREKGLELLRRQESLERGLSVLEEAREQRTRSLLAELEEKDKRLRELEEERRGDRETQSVAASVDGIEGIRRTATASSIDLGTHPGGFPAVRVARPGSPSGSLLESVGGSTYGPGAKLSHDQLLIKLRRGSIFLKHGRYGSPHARFVWVSPDLSTISWRPVATQKLSGSIRTSDLCKVVPGCTSSVFRRHKGRPGRDNACLSLYCKGRTLDLEVELLGNPSFAGVKPEEKESRDVWVEAFRALLELKGGASDGAVGSEGLVLPPDTSHVEDSFSKSVAGDGLRAESPDHRSIATTPGVARHRSGPPPSGVEFEGGSSDWGSRSARLEGASGSITSRSAGELR